MKRIEVETLPITVQAIQWDGTDDGFMALRQWLMQELYLADLSYFPEIQTLQDAEPQRPYIVIRPINGGLQQVVHEGDWITVDPTDARVRAWSATLFTMSHNIEPEDLLPPPAPEPHEQMPIAALAQPLAEGETLLVGTYELVASESMGIGTIVMAGPDGTVLPYAPPVIEEASDDVQGG